MAREFQLRDLADLLLDTTIADTLKSGKKARVPLARVGSKVLFLMLDMNDATGEWEISSEWSIFSTASAETGQTLSAGSRFSIPKLRR